MKIVFNKFIPFKGYLAINLFGVLFVRGTEQDRKDDLTPEVINHEKIHTAQMKEMLYIFFYLWYAIEYLIIRGLHKKQSGAYHDVSFEEEAHNNDMNLNYLNERKPYAWLKFVKGGSSKEE